MSLQTLALRKRSVRSLALLAALVSVVSVFGSAKATEPDPADANGAAESVVAKRLYLQPLGAELSSAATERAAQALRSFFPFDVQVLPVVALPTRAYYAPRKRYRAEVLLRFLEERRPADGFRILGITSADISTTKGKIYDFGILGLATLSGEACVISTFRTSRAVKTRTEAQVRFAKVAVHEIGHTLGLDHCPAHGCLMEDGKGTVLTLDHEHDLCPRCRAKLRSAGYVTQPAPADIWQH